MINQWVNGDGPGEVVGVLLAGGLARRMGGGDKPLKTLGGQTILARVIERALPQVDSLILNANGDPERFNTFGLPVICDIIDDYAGPLAGILSAMMWAREQKPEARWLVSFACDAPFYPTTMVSRLLREVDAEQAQMACAASQGRTHPVFALWPIVLADELRAAMEQENMRKIDLWTSRYHSLAVDFTTEPGGLDPFYNINRPEDLVEAKSWIGKRGLD
jgi:molybdopterin-guanine dinucleotide biosynthesis protein A